MWFSLRELSSDWTLGNGPNCYLFLFEENCHRAAAVRENRPGNAKTTFLAVVDKGINGDRLPKITHTRQFFLNFYRSLNALIESWENWTSAQNGRRAQSLKGSLGTRLETWRGSWWDLESAWLQQRNVDIARFPAPIPACFARFFFRVRWKRPHVPISSLFFANFHTKSTSLAWNASHIPP